MTDYPTPYKDAAVKLLACPDKESFSTALTFSLIDAFRDVWTPDYGSLTDVLNYLSTGELDERRYNESIHMQWSVGDWDDDIAVFTKDLDAGGVDDGTYDVLYVWGGLRRGEANGVVVKDGKFVEEPTLIACAHARNKAQYHGTFLELIEWNKKANKFEIAIGS